MTNAELDAIEARCAKATPGPWRRLPSTTRGRFTFGANEIIFKSGQPGHRKVVGWSGFDQADGTKGQKTKNAIFIAHAPTDIAALLAEVRRLRALIHRLHPDHPTFDINAIAAIASEEEA